MAQQSANPPPVVGAEPRRKAIQERMGCHPHVEVARYRLCHLQLCGPPNERPRFVERQVFRANLSINVVAARCTESAKNLQKQKELHTSHPPGLQNI